MKLQIEACITIPNKGNISPEYIKTHTHTPLQINKTNNPVEYRQRIGIDDLN